MTTKGPEGRMTRPLITEYNVGDEVRLVSPSPARFCDCGASHIGKNGQRAPRVGETGVIRNIGISAPHDGDETFLIFDVKFSAWGLTDQLTEDMFRRVKHVTKRKAA